MNKRLAGSLKVQLEVVDQNLIGSMRQAVVNRIALPVDQQFVEPDGVGVFGLHPQLRAGRIQGRLNLRTDPLALYVPRIDRIGVVSSDLSSVRR